jgi:hypothetical protein
MKFETVILRGLFVASMLVSGLILATMLTSRAAPMNLAASTSLTSLLTAAPSSCVLPIVDGMICTRASI